MACFVGFELAAFEHRAAPRLPRRTWHSDCIAKAFIAIVLSRVHAIGCWRRSVAQGAVTRVQCAEDVDLVALAFTMWPGHLNIIIAVIGTTVNRKRRRKPCQFREIWHLHTSPGRHYYPCSGAPRERYRRRRNCRLCESAVNPTTAVQQIDHFTSITSGGVLHSSADFAEHIDREARC